MFSMSEQIYFQVKVVMGQPEEERGERDKTSKRYYGLVIHFNVAALVSMSVQYIPLIPHFYVVKLGYVGVYLFFFWSKT